MVVMVVVVVVVAEMTNQNVRTMLLYSKLIHTETSVFLSATVVSWSGSTRCPSKSCNITWNRPSLLLCFTLLAAATARHTLHSSSSLEPPSAIPLEAETSPLRNPVSPSMGSER